MQILKLINKLKTLIKEKKTNNVYQQNPVSTGYNIVSELHKILQSGYYESPPAYKNVDCFVDDVKKIQNKQSFYFKNTNKYNIMTEKDEEDYRKTIICHFCEKERNSDKVRDCCH